MALPRANYVHCRIGLFCAVAAAVTVGFAVGCRTGNKPVGGSGLANTDPDLEDPFPTSAMIVRAQQRDYWPTKTQGWKPASDAEKAILNGEACKNFAKLVFPPAGTDEAIAARLGKPVSELQPKEESLKTDGLMVIKNGRVYMEQYAEPYKTNPEKLHCMWSASKSFTAGVVGAVAELSERKVKDGVNDPAARTLPNNTAIKLTTTMKELMGDEIINARPEFANLTVEHFLAMAPNLDWSERYEDDVTASSIIRMLWIKGYDDMAKFAGNQPFGPEGAGKKFVYSSGNALILMRALQSIYRTGYDTMPWDVLFDRIGMNKVVFERDQKGVYVGSSYVHTTLRDMAKFGYAYLNGGWYNGQQVIQKEFVDKARALSVGMAETGTEEKDIEHEEAFYGMGFWINPSPAYLTKISARKKAFSDSFRKTKYFPKASGDVFFAAGHYGQNILMFPKEDLMIVRMSHDREYWSKLDDMFSLAKSCFLPEESH